MYITETAKYKKKNKMKMKTKCAHIVSNSNRLTAQQNRNLEITQNKKIEINVEKENYKERN